MVYLDDMLSGDLRNGVSGNGAAVEVLSRASY